MSTHEQDLNYIRYWGSDEMDLEITEAELMEAHLTLQRLAHLLEGADEGTYILAASVVNQVAALGRLTGLLEHSDICAYCQLNDLAEIELEEEEN